MTQYKHTQLGTLLIAISLFVCSIVYILTLPLDEPYILLTLTPILIVAVLFSSLTVKIEGDSLIWYFGPKFWKKNIPLADIQPVTEVQTSWMWGWGIRFTPQGWLYNVSGTCAIKLALMSGETIMIGTDDANNLLHAINLKKQVN